MIDWTIAHTLRQKVNEQNKLILELIDENNKFRGIIKLLREEIKSKNEYELVSVSCFISDC